jgi:hypothetical protein
MNDTNDPFHKEGIESPEPSQAELEEANLGNEFIKKIRGRKAKGWRPRLRKRPEDILVSPKQLRGINHG